MKARVAVRVGGLALLAAGLLPMTELSIAGASVRAADTPSPGGSWQPDPVRYGMTIVRNVPLKMDDGVTLLANVGYPSDVSTGNKASGSFPVLLTQDPYSGAAQLPNSYYVTRGYINAVVEVVEPATPTDLAEVRSHQRSLGPVRPRTAWHLCNGLLTDCLGPMAS